MMMGPLTWMKLLMKMKCPPSAPRRTSSAPSTLEQSTPLTPAAQAQLELTTLSIAGKTPVIPPVGKWRNLFASNHNSSAYPKLKYFSANTKTKGCALLDEDMDDACDVWKTCIVGFIARKFPELHVLHNIIENSWKCSATLSMHEFGWLVYKFNNGEDRAKVLSEGPYLVYGRPLVLKLMTEYFDFTSAEMSKVPIWIKFPNLPLKCWFTNCLQVKDDSPFAVGLGQDDEADLLVVMQQDRQGIGVAPNSLRTCDEHDPMHAEAKAMGEWEVMRRYNSNKGISGAAGKKEEYY
ncbi:hypothetical protein SADUNF_Sadunf16G0069400 [Salix dunnii]|uniref:DUF4283 domain-containing protein n=1 Tax=Salix dunnii TaxID=1413687 RepID=A0A835JCU8_9ROSI|nr:hypothetical protein SADUNF_Sadunf16G0069400 [Salix dunnii]